ncbi:MAG: ankyrin repeat domain-containing protein [Candidatus Micrarchaeota archaeon]|nr:ankyrin repeat domain-containing protein [Candidatus Micrarchaeota archaeon]
MAFSQYFPSKGIIMEPKRVRIFKARKTLDMLVHMREGKLLFKSAKLCTDTSLKNVSIDVQHANAMLLYAARNNMLGEAKMALDAFANPNVTDCFGFTPLLWALANRNEELALLLISRGASIHVRNPLGEVPLMVAAYFGMVGAARRIIHAGAVLNARNAYRMTALMCAAQGGSEDAAALLISAGADPALTDSRMLSALDYAHYLRHKNVEGLLRVVCSPPDLQKSKTI